LNTLPIMKIRAKLLFLGLLPLLIIALLGLLWNDSQRTIEQLRHSAEAVDGMGQKAQLLASLTSEYLRTDEARPRQQLAQGFRELGPQLQALDGLLLNQDNQLLAEEIVARAKQAQWSFNEYERVGSHPDNAIQMEYRQEIGDRLQIELRSLQPLTHLLHHSTHIAGNTYQEQLKKIALAVLFFSALLILVLTLPLLLRLNRALQALTDGARRIGQGELNLGIHIPGRDELSELAAHFNDMARNLASARSNLEASNAELTRRTAALETANHDLENFSYSVSHDLRAPLRAIDGFIAMLLDEHASQLDADGRRMFGVVSDNARKMGHLIDDILAFSRAGRLELDPVPVDMQALAREVWSDLLEGVPGRTIELELGDLPAAQCDPRAIRQVWQNLLGNAIKFTRDRNPAVIQVSATNTGEFIRYEVADNGAGFNADYAGKLFQLFQRLHGMDEFPGTGVGLAIVKRFIQKHGGTVEGVGVVNQGATFSFTLPIRQDIPHIEEKP